MRAIALVLALITTPALADVAGVARLGLYVRRWLCWVAKWTTKLV